MRILHACVVGTLVLVLAGCSSSPGETKEKAPEAAEIVSFVATPPDVIAGDPSILSWDTKNVTVSRLEDEAGKVLFESRHAGGTFTVVPETSRLYRLIVRGKNGKELQKQVAIETRPGPGPSADFRIEPSEVPIGDPIRLVWETSGTTGVVIRSGGEVVYETDRLLSGSIEIIADKDAVYTLTANGRWGRRELPAEVKVKPIILSFTGGNTAPVAKGSETALSWRTRGADELTIRTPEGLSWTVPPADVVVGSMVLPMGESGTFELVARKGAFETVQGHEVSILGAPRIQNLRATPSPITDGELFTVTVSWEVDWAQDGVLTWGSGKTHPIGWMEIGRGSFDIQISEATDIVLQARNSQASSSTSFRVTTIPEPVPSLSGPLKVARNENFILRWDAPGAAHISLTRNGERVDVPPDAIPGSMNQAITARTEYRLDATNPSGSVRTTSMVVEIGAPSVVDLGSDRVRYGSGTPMVISWEVNGGTRLEILDEEGQALPGCNLIDGGGLKGSCTVPAPNAFGTYIYRLEVENGEGMAARAFSLRVGEGPAVDLFAANKAKVTTGDEFSLRWLVLDDVDGSIPLITIRDGRGGNWQFQGTHLRENSLELVAGLPGSMAFTLTAEVPGRAPVVVDAEVQIFQVPEVTVAATPPVYHLWSGIPVVLEWQSTGASSIAVHRSDETNLPVGPAIYQTTASSEVIHGTLNVEPVFPGQSYVVVAKNSANRAVQASIHIPSPDDPNPIEFFTVSANTVAAATPVVLNWSVRGTGTTLAPFLDDAPREVTATAPFINIRQTGTQKPFVTCNTSHGDLDEGCEIVNFPNGFTFPFDGLELAGVMATANGNLSTTLSRSIGGMWTSAAFPTGSSSNMGFTQFAPLWFDSLAVSADPLTHQLFDGPEGRYQIVQYTNVSSSTFQVVFWESGALDFRYGAVSSASNTTANSRSIGWQDRDRTKGHNLNGSGRTAVPGGLTNRSWRYFEKLQPNTGTVTIPVRRTTVFSLCAVGPLGRSCERRTVRVQ